ncbi:MAG: nitroreductase/quinone reductase family protein [Caldilineales bacterium]
MSTQPALSRSDESLRQMFKAGNHFMVLLFRLGLGNWGNRPETSQVMVLIHRGRKTGLLRRTPVNFAVVDGDIYCTAAFGSHADWYRNIQASPNVEVWLPHAWYAGVAAEVPADDRRRNDLMRQVLIASGFAAPLFAGVNPKTIGERELAELSANYRLIRIKRTGRTAAAGQATWHGCGRWQPPCCWGCCWPAVSNEVSEAQRLEHRRRSGRSGKKEGNSWKTRYLWPMPPNTERQQRSPKRSATRWPRPDCPSMSGMPAKSRMCRITARWCWAAQSTPATGARKRSSSSNNRKPRWRSDRSGSSPAARPAKATRSRCWTAGASPEGQQPIADRIGPKDIAVFGGAIDPDKLNFGEKLIIKAVKAQTGDFRDWDAINAWAQGIAGALQA